MQSLIKSQPAEIETGRVMISMAVVLYMSSDPSFISFVGYCLQRHKGCDWGEVSEAVQKINLLALEEADEVFSFFNVPSQFTSPYGLWNMPSRLFINTDAFRRQTTIRFEEECPR